MQPAIPSDERERAQEVIQTLHEQLARLFQAIPDGPDSAVVFRFPEEA